MRGLIKFFRFSDGRKNKTLTGFMLPVVLFATGCGHEVRQSEINSTGPEVVASGPVGQCENGIPGCLWMTSNSFEQQDEKDVLQSYIDVSDIVVEEPAHSHSDENISVNQQYVDSEQGVHPISQDQPVQPTLIELSQQALYQTDVQKKIDAINAIALYRNDQAIETLLQATSDSESVVRYLALQTLRYAVADGLDQDGRIVAVLEQARLDYDQQVAQLAERIAKELSTPTPIELP